MLVCNEFILDKMFNEEIFILFFNVLSSLNYMQLFIDFIWPFLCSLLTGFLVYRILKIKDNRHWSSSRKKILKNLDSILKAALTSIRIAAGVKYCNFSDPAQEYVFLIKEFEKDNSYKALRTKLEDMDEEKRKSFLLNIRNLQESLRFFITIFISFRNSDNWHMEKLLEFNEKIYKASVLYATFPEICYANDKTTEIIKKIAISDVIELTDFIFNFREEFYKKNKKYL